MTISALDPAIDDDSRDSSAADDSLPQEGRHGLAEDEIELVTHYLRLGRRLPSHLLPRLFEVPREYQLSYAGKLRESDVLADTMAVPLQAQRVFGSGAEAAANSLIMGDNLQVLKQLVELKRDGKLTNLDGTDGARLIYLDPPFATGEVWETRSGRVAYSDKVRGAEFIEWLRRRLILMKQLMSTDGSIVIHLDQRYVHYIKVVMDELLPGNFRNEIVVPRGAKGVQSQFERIDALAQGHYSLLLYSRNPTVKYRKLFDQGEKPSRWDTFWLGTNRPTMRYELFGRTPPTGQWRWSKDKAFKAIENYQAYLADNRGLHLDEWAALVEAETDSLPDLLREGANGPQWYRYAKTKQLASDVWTVKSKGSVTGYPTEKHADLLTRIVEWLTVEGDLVVDAFSGSGTTVAVADSLDRRWIGIDAGKYAIYTAQSRLLDQARKEAREVSFTTYNAGLYDYATLRGLPWEQYLAFAMQLFQCREQEESLGGVNFQGMLGDHRVLVFDYRSHDGGQIGRGFVEDIVNLCGDRLGDRCFIIAPAAAVELYEDYVDVAGVRFYFLRIPYSVIAELHKRGFSQLTQPKSVEATNNIVDSVGFDFIQPPSVETLHTWDGDTLTVTMSSFESEAFTANASAGFAELAMVMVDSNFDGDVFVPTNVFFDHQLEKTSYEFRVEVLPEAVRVGVTYIDVYGNEYREAFDVAARSKASGVEGSKR